MDQLCYELLNGTLTWDGGDAYSPGSMTNNLPTSVTVDIVANPGEPKPYVSGFPKTLEPGGTWSTPARGGYYKVTVAATGGLVSVFEQSEEIGEQDLTFDKDTLNFPNDIGPIPIPTSSVTDSPIQPSPATPRPDSTVLIPPDSARVLVGIGVVPNGNVVVREQFYERQSDSISLAGNEQVTVSYTATEGMTDTSSSSESMSESLSLSGSGGWGPVSASLSASLSHSSTSMQQVTVTSQKTTYFSQTISNPHDEPVAYYRWQLNDVITVFTDDEPISTIIHIESPSVVMGPYWVSPRPTPPDDGGVSERSQHLLKYDTK